MRPAGKKKWWTCLFDIRTSFPLCECDRQAVGSHAYVIHRRHSEPVYHVLPSGTPLHNTLQRLALRYHPGGGERETTLVYPTASTAFRFFKYQIFSNIKYWKTKL